MKNIKNRSCVDRALLKFEPQHESQTKRRFYGRDSICCPVHLSQISKIQKICSQIKKESGQAVQASVQKDILQKIENKNSAQTDLILAREFQVEIKVDEKKVTQRDESARVELTFTKDEMALMKKAQELLSTKTGGGFKSTLLDMAK